MPDVTGKQLDVAKDAVKNAGFDDDVKISGGGIFGIVVESNWEVCTQTPVAGRRVSSAPRLTVARSCKQDAPEATATPTPIPSPSPSETSQLPRTKATQIISPRNNKEMAALLTVSDGCDAPVAKFAHKYAGRKIQFNGSIANLAPHGSYHTRYDILVSPGDKGPNSVIGPAFKFENFNVFDLNLIGRSVPEYIEAGDRFHFVASVDHYNQTQCLFFLNPVSTKVR